MDTVSLEMYKAGERRMTAREARRGFHIHAIVTLLVVVVLTVVNAFVASEFPWAVFPAVGMSIGLWFHWFFGVYRGEALMLRHQEEVEREAQRLAA